MGHGPPEKVLRQRLARVQALADRAATEGERNAALAAADRLRDRLATAVDPMPADPLLDPVGRGWPTRTELREQVCAWMAGQRANAAVADWAQDHVGRWLLPDAEVHDPESIAIEVLLQLSTLHLGALEPARDGAALLAFLDTAATDTEHGWRAWYRHLRGEPAPTFGQAP